MENKIQQIKRITIILFLTIICISVVFIIYNKINKTNPYENETVIDNFLEYYPQATQDNINSINYILYTAITQHLSQGEKPPKKGATIRKNSVKNNTFIVDISSVQQSYKITFPYKATGDLSIEDYTISCPTNEERIYNTYCFIQQEDDLSLTIEHSYLLKNTTNELISSWIYNSVYDFINSKEERGDNINSDYILEISENSFTNYQNQDNKIIFSLKASTSDGKKYIIYINANKDNYHPSFALLIKNTNTESYYAHITTIEDNENEKEYYTNWFTDINNGTPLKTIDYSSFTGTYKDKGSRQ